VNRIRAYPVSSPLIGEYNQELHHSSPSSSGRPYKQQRWLDGASFVMQVTAFDALNRQAHYHLLPGSISISTAGMSSPNHFSRLISRRLCRNW
jgi:hypothetical protein